jgi:Rad3-related DNA helicase
MTAFWREKEMIIFFASIAHHLPEHASQAVSRPLSFPLISLEKRAKLAQPLSQNTQKSAQK